MKTPKGVYDTTLKRARGLVWIRTLACGAGDPGFKSQRARHSARYLNQKKWNLQVVKFDIGEG
jgi:hypothetical protein